MIRSLLIASWWPASRKSNVTETRPRQSHGGTIGPDGPQRQNEATPLGDLPAQRRRTLDTHSLPSKVQFDA
jgi:hypothetical protein